MDRALAGCAHVLRTGGVERDVLGPVLDAPEALVAASLHENLLQKPGMCK